MKGSGLSVQVCGSCAKHYGLIPPGTHSSLGCEPCICSDMLSDQMILISSHVESQVTLHAGYQTVSSHVASSIPSCVVSQVPLVWKLVADSQWEVGTHSTLHGSVRNMGNFNFS